MKPDLEKTAGQQSNNYNDSQLDGSPKIQQCTERLALEHIVWSALEPSHEQEPPDQAGEHNSSRLSEFARRFGLSAFDTDVVALLWVIAFRPEWREKFAAHGEMLGHVTPALVARLFHHPERVHLHAESPLSLWQWVDEHPRSDNTAQLLLDPLLISWLQGTPECDRILSTRTCILTAHGTTSDTTLNYLSPLQAEDLPDDWPVELSVTRLRQKAQQGLGWRVWVNADDKDNALRFCLTMATELGLPLLAVPPLEENASLLGNNEPLFTLRLHRQAWLDHCALVIDARDATLWRGPPGIAAFPFQFIIGAPNGTEKVCTNILQSITRICDILIELPELNAQARRSFWLRALPDSASWPSHELDELSLQHASSLADIRQAANTEPINAQEAAQRLRQWQHNDFSGLAQRLSCTFEWDDLILPSDTKDRLADITFEARERNRVWSDANALRLYPQGRGLVALFSGPAGTGKTMAAQVMAADLGLDLLRIDLSAVLSKWVGETAQHIQRLLSSSSAKNSILFFDEADALYGKRVEEIRDAQDRFANMDVSHLMVALEDYDGIVLLATNLKANIDPAFIRRIRHSIDFPKPGLHARIELWRRILTGLFGTIAVEHLHSDLERLAAIEATGAQIKNVALSTLFSTRRTRSELDTDVLGQNLARELAKDGAGLSIHELDSLIHGEVRP